MPAQAVFQIILLKECCPINACELRTFVRGLAGKRNAAERWSGPELSVCAARPPLARLAGLYPWLAADVLTCRLMLIDPTGREQRNYRSFRPNMARKDRIIRALKLWMEGNVESKLSVAKLAHQAGLSAGDFRSLILPHRIGPRL